MAGSRFEYVRQFEIQNPLLQNTYIVVRIDGKGFTKFTTLHGYEKPNDLRGLSLMNKCAEQVMKTFPDIWIAYGQSDEYSFVFKRKTQVFNRRSEKLVSCVVSCFSSSFALFFNEFFKDHKLSEVPVFDSRCICYPTEQNLRDYLSWRQADCHINNLYNTCFWALVQQDKKSTEEAHKLLKNTFSGDKNELLFSKFGINYSKIEAVERKGTILLRIVKEKEKPKSKSKTNKKPVSELSEGKQIAKKTEIQQASDLAEDLAKMELKEEEKETANKITMSVVDEQSIVEDKGVKDEVKEEGVKEDKDKGIADDIKDKELESKEIITLHEDLIQDSFWEKYKEYTLL